MKYGLELLSGNRGRNWEVDSLFDNLYSGINDFFGDFRYKKEGNLVYEIECPGFNKENLTIEIDDGIVTVQGSRGEGERKREIFKRMSVSNSEEVEAEIKDGILTLTFKQPQKKTTKLEIK
jgi:HSP20 family molecular chaperone IbpA